MDGDSGIASEEYSTESDSLLPETKNYRYENGRRYHADENIKYLLPNDTTEQNRLDSLHYTFKEILNDRLYLAPILDDVQCVFDYGTGTGLWAIEFADRNGQAIVYGSDISPIQPNIVPPNCRFYCDDIELEWAFEKDYFDFIHGRSMVGSISDWDKHFTQTFSHLKHGGWAENQEFDIQIYAEGDPNLMKTPYIREWQALCYEASEKIGKGFNISSELKQKMANAGFENIIEILFKSPIGPWAEGISEKLRGLDELDHVIRLGESLTPAVFTILERNPEDAKRLKEKIMKEIQDSENRLYMTYRILYGQKPAEPRMEEIEAAE
jgi:SAM-dependent methyltransferase